MAAAARVHRSGNCHVLAPYWSMGRSLQWGRVNPDQANPASRGRPHAAARRPVDAALWHGRSSSHVILWRSKKRRIVPRWRDRPVCLSYHAIPRWWFRKSPRAEPCSSPDWHQSDNTCDRRAPSSRLRITLLPPARTPAAYVA